MFNNDILTRGPSYLIWVKNINYRITTTGRFICYRYLLILFIKTTRSRFNALMMGVRFRLLLPNKVAYLATLILHVIRGLLRVHYFSKSHFVSHKPLRRTTNLTTAYTVLYFGSLDFRSKMGFRNILTNRYKSIQKST